MLDVYLNSAFSVKTFVAYPQDAAHVLIFQHGIFNTEIAENITKYTKNFIARD